MNRLDRLTNLAVLAIGLPTFIGLSILHSRLIPSGPGETLFSQPTRWAFAFCQVGVAGLVFLALRRRPAAA